MRQSYVFLQFMMSVRAVKILAARGRLSSLVLLPLAPLAGCSSPASLVRSAGDIDPERGLIAFSIDLSGTMAPVHITIDRDRMIGSSVLRKEFVFAPASDTAPGEPRFNQLALFSVSAAEIEIALVGIGEYWDFAGGKLEHSVEVKPGTCYYLGTVSIHYGKGESVDVYYPEEHETRVGTRPPMPSHATPRRRYLVSQMTVVNDERRARRVLAERFDLTNVRVVNRTGFWERTRGGGFLDSKRARPVTVVEP